MKTKDFTRIVKASPALVPSPAARSPEAEIFVAFTQLREHGVVYTRVHIRRLVAQGLFPVPVLMSPNRVAWRLSDLARWKASRPYAPVPESAMAAKNPGH